MPNEILAKSFLNSGEDYDRFRPGFPFEALAVIVPGPVGAALDLGAGTGKFTGLLTQRADRVVAVEPSEQMLAVLRGRYPTVEALVGSAEDIPVATGSVDVVTVAQAFHWFDRGPACAEIRRVLAPGGTLGLLWNRADPGCAWDRECSRIAHPHLKAATPASEPEDDLLPGFDAPEHLIVPWSEHITRSDYVSRWLTISSFLAADAVERARMVAEVEHVLDTDPATAGRDSYDLPQLTDVYVYRASDT